MQVQSKTWHRLRALVMDDYTHKICEDTISKYHLFTHNTFRGPYFPLEFQLRFNDDGTTDEELARKMAVCVFRRDAKKHG